VRIFVFRGLIQTSAFQPYSCVAIIDKLYKLIIHSLDNATMSAEYPVRCVNFLSILQNNRDLNLALIFNAKTENPNHVQGKNERVYGVERCH
jgi:hypothetical protein